MKTPGIGDGLPIQITEAMAAKSPVAPKPVVVDVAQSKIAESPLSRINTEADALGIAKARAQLKKTAGEISDADEQTFITEETHRILEEVAKPNLGEPKTIDGARTADAGSATTKLQDTKVKDGKQSEVPAAPEQTELTVEQDWAEIEDAFAKNHDPVEGSTVYQVRRDSEEGYWDDDPMKIDAYLTVHGVTTITSDIRQKEIARREKIRAAIKPVKDALDAEDAAEREIEATIFKDKITASDEIGRAAQRAQIESGSVTEIQAIRDKHYTVDNDGNYILDPNGKRVPVSVKAQTKTLVEEAIKDLSGDNSNPKRQARAKKNYDKLRDRIKDDGGFKPMSTEQLAKEKITKEQEGQSERAVGMGIRLIAQSITDADLFEREGGKADGKIIGLKKEALKKVQDNPRLARMVILTGHYYELQNLEEQGQPVSEQRHNTAAFIYQELISIPDNQIPEGLRAQITELKGQSALLKKRVDTMVRTIKEKWLENANYPLDETHFTQDLIIAAYCEHMGIKPELDRVANKQVLPESVTSLFDNPLENDFVLHLVNNGYVSNFFQENLHMNIKDLNTNLGKYMETVIGRVSNEIGGEGIKDWIANIIKGLMDEENIKKLLKEFKLPPGLGIVAMFALVLMPMGQQLADTGNEQEGGGKGGG